MNSKRKADLQRRLSMAPVPRPPADLLDRIKSDIPEYLRPETDRRRLATSTWFNLRIAASILIIISSVVGAVYLLAPEDAMKRSRSPIASAVSVAETKSTAALDEVQVEIAEQAAPPAMVQLTDSSLSAGAAAPSRDVVEHTITRRKEEPSAEEVVADAVAVVIANTAPVVADLPAPPPPAAAPAPTAVAAAEPVSVTAEAPQVEERAVAKLSGQSFVREAQAADLALGPPSSVFGISIDDSVFHRIKETLEKNQRPKAVNVEAIINYFANGAVDPPRRGVKLEVEGSPSPVGAIGDGGFLRFTVETASGTSRVPVASQAKLDIDWNATAVETANAVGDAIATAAEPALLPNLSVTGLYDVKLKPGLRAPDRVATVRLTYTSVADGKRHTIDKAVYVRDFGRVWTRASRRHRVASLGAVWAESLQASTAAPEVLKRAEELATQEPGDARAQELASAATASAKLPAF